MTLLIACGVLTPFFAARLPSEGFALLVVGAAIFASVSILGMVFDSSLPSQTQGTRLLIGVLSLAWIAFFTLASFQGGAFVGLLNLAPYFLLKAIRK